MVTLAQEDGVAHQLGVFDADAHLLRNPFENHAVARCTAVGTGVVDLEHQRQFAADAHRVAEHGRIGRRPLEPAGLVQPLDKLHHFLEHVHRDEAAQPADDQKLRLLIKDAQQLHHLLLGDGHLADGARRVE